MMLQADPRKTTAERIELRASGDPGDIAFVSGLFRRQRRLIAATMAVFFVMGLAVYLFATPSYRASATVLVDFKRLAALDENFSTPTGRIDSSAVLSQLELLRSAGVVNRVVSSLKLDEDPEFIGSVNGLKAFLAMGGLVQDPARLPPEERRSLAADALRAATNVQRVDLSYAINVGVTAGSGEKAARIVNAMAEAYIADQLDAKRDASEQASEWFSRRIADLQKDVTDADQAVVDYRLKNNIVTTDGKFIDETQLANLSQLVGEAGSSRASAEAKVAQADEVIRSGAEQGALVDEFSNEVVIKLRNAYLDEKRVAADLSVRYGPQHDAVQRANAKMGELQKAIQDEMSRIREAARTDLTVAQIREKTLQKELDDLTVRTLAAREARVRLTQLESASATVKTIRDTFMSRYVEGIQKQSFPMTEARIITVAQAPEKPAFPTATKTLGGSLVLGFGFGCLLGVARETFSRKIRFKRQVETAARSPCLGFLPMLPAAGAIALHGKDLSAALGDQYVETLRGLKVSVDLRRQGKNAIVGFVSAEPGEGKSVTASNLAQVCASGGAKTLLIDGNLRHSTISEMLASGQRSGLVEILNGKADIRETIVATDDANLQLLTSSGTEKPAYPDTVLLSEVLRRLVRKLSEHYQYVIVDLPALGAVSDARAVADLVDMFVMAVAWNKTETHTVADALRSNPQVTDRLLGSVLTFADMKQLEYLGETSAKLSAAYHA